MYSFVFCFHSYNLSKQTVKSGKVPCLFLTRSNIKKTAIIVSILVPLVYLRSFSLDPMCVNKREVTVLNYLL